MTLQDAGKMKKLWQFIGEDASVAAECFMAEQKTSFVDNTKLFFNHKCNGWGYLPFSASQDNNFIVKTI